MGRIVALTGATGFIGRILAERLADAGWLVRALVRPSFSSARVAECISDVVEGRLEDVGSLYRLVKGAEAVIHCAGLIRGSSEATFHSINAHGVGRLAEAAAGQQPSPRFLLISSVAAREPELSPYAASKRQGEITLAGRANEMAWAVLRPPVVYGPGDRGLRRLFAWMERGVGLVLGRDGARFSLLYVEDLAEAVMRWLERGSVERQVYEVHDGHPSGYTWENVIDAVSQLRGRRVHRIRVPEPALDLLATLNLGLGRMTAHSPLLTPWKLRELRHPDWVCNNVAFSRATGWAPRVSLEEGLRLTLSLETAMSVPKLS